MIMLPAAIKRLLKDKVIHICMLITFLVAFSGCNDEESAPDVSGVNVQLDTRRFDQDLAGIDTNHIAAGLQQLQQKYPDFLGFYLDTLMGFNIRGNYSDTVAGIDKGLRVFLTYKDYRALLDTVDKHFSDTKDINAQLEKGFKYLKFYYPDYHVPHIIYMVSYLSNWGAFTLDSNTMGIGLDMFLGTFYPYYKSVGIPDYMGTKLEPDYIPVAAMRAVYQERIPFKPDGSTLLDMMLQRGKEIYFIHKVLPFLPETIDLGYSTKQLEWCKTNEALIYNFFIRENLLYDNAWQKVLRYVNDGPNSTGMPPESPGNIGTWMGYQVVKAYMAQHPKMTLPQLLTDNSPGQRFLQESKYKPK